MDTWAASTSVLHYCESCCYKHECTNISFSSLRYILRNGISGSYGESESEVAQLCLTLCDPMDCSLSDFSVHGIFQTRLLEWVVMSFSRGSSQPRDQTRVSRIVGRHFTLWATRLDHMVILFLILWGTAILFSIDVAALYNATLVDFFFFGPLVHQLSRVRYWIFQWLLNFLFFLSIQSVFPSFTLG